MAIMRDVPITRTMGDHEVIQTPNTLRKHVSQIADSDPDDPVARAERALAELSSEFAGWMDEEVGRLEDARGHVKAHGFIKQTHEEFFHAAHDIKGAAATFGYPGAAEIADSLCRLVEHTPDMRRIPITLVDQHVDAVRAIIRTKTDASDPVVDQLIRRLREVTDEFLIHENRHRPEYLDGIAGLSPKPRDGS
ncbi:MAG TPA: Hpt domain-containing protein [Xanthobacteraceae bacterium]|jgi:chemotaxis protein histidine kinase CheA|nr:Hpt domain-containing protein [Xanthobacteraceae bacterium]